MDKRRKYYVVLDTETCPIDLSMGEVSPFNMFVYDVGFAVIDKRGFVYETHSYIVKDIFEREPALMKSSYYANKIPRYKEELRAGTRTMKTFFEIKMILREVMERYNTNIVICHNARFDDISLKNTERWLTKSRSRYFLPYGTIVWDTMKMALDTIAKQKTYIAWCNKNGYMTKHKKPRVQVKAEVLYRYISGKDDFIESHTGLEDVLIEKEIFVKCLRQHKPMRKVLYNN